MVDPVSPMSVLVIGCITVAGSIAPAYALMNRFLRDETSGWYSRRDLGVMLFCGSLFSTMVVVNGIATSSNTLFSFATVGAFIVVLLGALAAMVVVGALLAYPLRRFLLWHAPPDIVRENRP